MKDGPRVGGSTGRAVGPRKGGQKSVRGAVIRQPPDSRHELRVDFQRPLQMISGFLVAPHFPQHVGEVDLDDRRHRVESGCQLVLLEGLILAARFAQMPCIPPPCIGGPGSEFDTPFQVWGEFLCRASLDFSSYPIGGVSLTETGIELKRLAGCVLRLRQ